jgi:hypothetical protein
VASWPAIPRQPSSSRQGWSSSPASRCAVGCSGSGPRASKVERGG